LLHRAPAGFQAFSFKCSAARARQLRREIRHV